MTMAPTIPLEEVASCFGCAKSTVLFHRLHCTKSGHAKPIHNTEPCSEFAPMENDC